MEKQELSRELIKKMCGIAIDMQKRSYVPYSHFHVGCALLTKDGTIISGCNVENSSYPLCTCAERTAFAKAVSEGKHEFVAIAIAGGPEGGENDYCPPCGVCRQVMSEFCTGDFTLYLAKSIEDYKEYTLDEIMPMRFTPEHLKKRTGRA